MGAIPRGVLPRSLPLFPQRGEDGVGIRRIDVDVFAAGVLVHVEYALERPAAIGRAEDAALRAWSVGMTQCGDEQAVRVLRIDGNLRNLLGIAQPEMRPRRTRTRSEEHTSELQSPVH